MFWFLLIITYSELKYRTVHDIYKNDHCETDDELDDKILKKVIKMMDLFSYKIIHIETMLNISEARLMEYGYAPFDGCHDYKCYKPYYEINPERANLSIRKLYWQRKLLENMRSRFEKYYSDLLFNYLV